MSDKKSSKNPQESKSPNSQVDAMVRHDFEDLDEQLEKVKCIDDLLEVIFCDYLTTYYQDPPPGRKEFLEKLMNKIHEYRA